MMIADAFGIVVGIVLHKHIPEKLVKWIAAACFAGFGLIGLHEALDQILSPNVTIHHPVPDHQCLFVAFYHVAYFTANRETDSAGDDFRGC
jgi:small basic protein